MTRIAVLMVCYNRREKTLAAINDLYAQELPDRVMLSVVLVDSGSIDGTPDAVRQQFPEVRLIEVSNDVYWTRGTAIAMELAMQEGFHFYLWLNDDTRLYPRALMRVLSTYGDLSPASTEPAIIVGALQDPTSHRTTYGGQLREPDALQLEFRIIDPDETTPLRVDTMNGNVVLVSARAAGLVGNLDRAFNHQRGDIDYGLRASKLGVGIWLAPGYVGTCSRNPDFHVWKDGDLSVAQRWRRIVGAKHFPPRETFVYCTRHGGSFWFVAWIRPYLSGIRWTVFQWQKNLRGSLKRFC